MCISFLINFCEFEKALASTVIIATIGVHLPKSALTDVTMKSNSVLTNPMGKDGVQSWLL